MALTVAMSKCPHCSSTSFETTVQTPSGCNYALVFVQCSSCGAPFGVLGYYNEFDKLIAIEDRIKKIERRLGTFT